MFRLFLGLFLGFFLLGRGLGQTVPPSPSADSLGKKRGIFLRAYQLFQKGELQASLPLFSRALEVYPQLEDYSLYYLGLLFQKNGKPQKALSYLQRLLKEHPESVWFAEAALAVGKIFLAQGNGEEAWRYGKMARREKQTQAEATLLMAHARKAQGKLSLAYALYQRVRKNWPDSAAAKEAKDQVYKLRLAHPSRFALSTEEDFLAEGFLLFGEKDEKGLKEALTFYRQKFPSGRHYPQMLYLLARTYKGKGKPNQAISLLAEVLSYHPKSAPIPQALYLWGSILWNQDRDEEARQVFLRLAQDYPSHPLAADALYALGRIWQEEGQNALAADTYGQLARRFPQSPLAEEGRWRRGWMAYRRGHFEQAQRLFSRLALKTPSKAIRASALYWQARSAEKSGKLKEANRLYQRLLQKHPNSYYTLWAEKRLGVSLTPLPSNHRNTPVAVIPMSLNPRSRTHLLRSQELKALGLFPLAQRELKALEEDLGQVPSLLPALLREYASVEGYTSALRLAQSPTASGNGRWYPYLYPRAYWEAVQSQANRKGLDPYLVLALIRQESLFDPEALSPAGALGLMQLLPTTAARLVGSNLPSLTDPWVNLDLGTTYLRQLLDLYTGDLILALAAYNAGERAVEKWQKRYRGLEADEFVESLSFRETRSYVKLVLRNYRTYLRLYEKSPAVPLRWSLTAKK